MRTGETRFFAPGDDADEFETRLEACLRLNTHARDKRRAALLTDTALAEYLP
jgi:hypothetical protein